MSCSISGGINAGTDDQGCRIVSSSGPTPPAPPLAGAIWWCYADTLAVGDASPWNDLGAGANVFATAGSKPQCAANQVNGLKAVQFVAGSSQSLQTTFSQGLQAQKNTIFLVLKYSGGTFVCDGIDASNRNALLNVGGNTFQLFCGSDGVTTSVDLSEFCILTLELNGSTKIFKNGVLIATLAAGGEGIAGFTLGASYLLAQYSSFSIAAHGGYHNIGDTDRQGIQATLGTRYAITLGQPQITSLAFAGLTGSYLLATGGATGLGFVFPSANGTIYGIWFNVGSVQSQPDMSGAGVTSYIEVACSTLDNAVALAVAVFNDIGPGTPSSPWTVPDPSGSDTLVATDKTIGAVASASDFNIGGGFFVPTVSQTGSGNS